MFRFSGFERSGTNDTFLDTFSVLIFKNPCDSNVQSVLRTTGQKERKLPYLSLFSENVTGGK